MAKVDSSSTFADNMSLPVHRWYRYSAGFSAEWVKQTVKEYLQKTKKEKILVLDPFSGSGTTLLACDEIGVSSIGYLSLIHISSLRVAFSLDFPIRMLNCFLQWSHTTVSYTHLDVYKRQCLGSNTLL